MIYLSYKWRMFTKSIFIYCRWHPWINCPRHHRWLVSTLSLCETRDGKWRNIYGCYVHIIVWVFDSTLKVLACFLTGKVRRSVMWMELVQRWLLRDGGWWQNIKISMTYPGFSSLRCSYVEDWRISPSLPLGEMNYLVLFAVRNLQYVTLSPS